MTILLSFVFLFVVNSLSFGKDRSRFDSAYYHISVNLAGTNVQEALWLADSLKNVAVSDLESMRVQMLVASLQAQVGNRQEALQNAMEAESIATKNNWYDWQARICGFLSTQFRTAGLLSEGKSYLEKGLLASSHLTMSEEVHRLSGLAFQEKAYYAMLDKKHNEAIGFLLISENSFEQLENQPVKFFFLATNEELLGKNYLKIQEYDLAFVNYERAIGNIEKSGGIGTALLGFVYLGLGKIHFINEEFNDAYKLYIRAEEIANVSDFLNLKLEVYEEMVSYFHKVGDLENFANYSSKLKQSLISDKESSASTADTMVKYLRETKETGRNYMNFLIGISIVTCVGLLFFGIYAHKNQYFNNNKTLTEHDDDQVDSTSPSYSNNDLELSSPNDELNVDKTLEIKSRDKDLMSQETEEMLLRKLRSFELKQKYTERGISLPALAARMKTNTKYLSYIINKHKGKDFNGYINELRIQFILAKMEDDSKYLEYKISYLAEESGFSSHSKFTMVFKQLTGLSPSIYMENIRGEKSKSKFS